VRSGLEMQPVPPKPKYALSYYIAIFIVLICLIASIVQKIFPVDELLDALSITAILVLTSLVLFAIFAAWRVGNNGR